MMINAPVFANATNELIDEHLQAGHRVRFVITTTSMLPMLAPGDQVIVAPTTPEQLRVGDIIVWRASGTWLAHRFIERRTADAWIITKGDNHPFADSPQPAIYARGVVVALQNDTRQTNLVSTRVRWLSRWIASWSRRQAAWVKSEPNLAQRIASKICRVLIVACAWTARQIAI
ncbi:signal peptidase I [Anaerolineae bacterium]|nr:signal peptidase I [Anaerolineae bacterium]